MPTGRKWLALAFLTVALVGLPAGGTHSPAVAPAPPFASPSTLTPSAPSVREMGPSWNLTLAPGLVPTPAALLPNSADDPPPNPATPPVTPTEVTFGPTVTSTLSCCIEHNFPAPSGGPWARIILNFTGGISGGVFDTSYRAYVDQVLVLYGTTPEYGTWNVRQDLTEYSSLFQGSVNLTYILSAVSNGGYYTSNVSLWFYPLPAGTPAPGIADQVIPLWSSTPYIHSASPVAFATHAIPSNVSSATLELWTYAFGATEEFWYSGASPYYRAMTVAVDGTTLLRVLPFPYLNTGGIDLFLWRPVTAAFTPSDRPYQFDATAMLGLLEGPHNFSVRVEGMPTTGATWLVAGTLLLHTNSSVTGATTTRFSASPETVVTSTPSGGFDQSVNYTFQYGSDIRSGGLVDHASLTVRADYSTNVSNSANWQNLSLHERMASDSSDNVSGIPQAIHSVYDFALSADLFSAFIVSSMSGGNTFGNATVKIEACNQVWRHADYVNLTSGSGSPSASVDLIANALTGASGGFTGAEELLGGGGAYLLGISNLVGTTPSEYQEQSGLSGTSGSYTHVIVASGDNPPGPNNAETVTTDSVGAAIGASASATPRAVDLGSTLELSVSATGGVSWPTYLWSNLPTGCAAQNAPTISCSPTATGAYSPMVSVEDSSGDFGIASAGAVTVNPRPTITILGAPSAADISSAVLLRANVTGGTGPFLCAWAINGTPTSTQSCGTPFLPPLGALGPITLEVTVTDAGGGSATSPIVSLTVLPPPSVTLHATSSAAVGTPITLHAVVSGGEAPFTYFWSNAGATVGVTLLPWFNYTATVAGALEFSVRVTDGSNLTALSGSTPVSVSATPIAASSSELPLLWIGIAAAGWAGAAVGLALYFRGRSALRKAHAEMHPSSDEELPR